jgi:hypothetical protein
LYYDIVVLAMLQGTYQSAISIRNIIPIEDFSETIAPVISTLVADTDVQAFSQGWFQRNNWKDNDIWKTVTPKFFLPRDAAPVGIDQYENEIYQYTSTSYFPNIQNLNVASVERRILTLSETFNFIEVGADFVLVPRVVNEAGDQIDIQTGRTITPSMFAQRKAKGDLSLKDVYGYKKVKFGNGEPLTYTEMYKGEPMTKFVYKLINLHGDGVLGSEYYLDFQPSVLDNGTVKIANEIPDSDIINYFAPEAANVVTFDGLKEFTDEQKKNILTNFAQKYNMTEDKAIDYINEALSKDRKKVIDKLKECY